MKCSECGGQIISSQYAVYRYDGGSSGNYRCNKCGKFKEWKIDGRGEVVVDMSDSSFSEASK